MTGTPVSRLGRFAAGVRVLDLCTFLPGPLASLLLADMGAEVLKIEPPEGDALLQVGPSDGAGEKLFHGTVNAGKTVQRMDLKQPEVKAEFLRLVDGFDVLIEGFRPGVMKRLGLDYAVLREINPGLVYCSLSGYGASGPSARAAGHDTNYLAASGILHRNGQTSPFAYDPPLADVSGSLFGVIAILGALRARDADGQGCEIDVGLADAPMVLQLLAVAEYGGLGTVPQRRQTYMNGGAAYYRAYATREGRHMALGAIEPKFWAAFCVAMERPDWMTRQTEALPQSELIADVAATVATMTTDECIARIGAADCCFSPVLDLGEAIASPHHAARGIVRTAPDGRLLALFPAKVDGQVPAIRPKLRQRAGDRS